MRPRLGEDCWSRGLQSACFRQVARWRVVHSGASLVDGSSIATPPGSRQSVFTRIALAASQDQIGLFGLRRTVLAGSRTQSLAKTKPLSSAQGSQGARGEPKLLRLSSRSEQMVDGRCWCHPSEDRRRSDVCWRASFSRLQPRPIWDRMLWPVSSSVPRPITKPSMAKRPFQVSANSTKPKRGEDCVMCLSECVSQLSVMS